MRTPLCDLLGIEHPVLQAAIGGAAQPELAAAVSNAGGLGAVALSGCGADGTREYLARTRSLTNRGFVGNLILAFDIESEFTALLADPPRVVSLFWGDPAPYAARIHDAGSMLMMSVGSLAEAVRAAEAGADIVVAQGWEAGGHVRGTVGTLALVPAVVDAISPIPVVAAGGITDGRGLAAALALGAQAAWMGTRFLASSEAAAHRDYRARVLGASTDDTFHSALFDVGWPDAPGRVLRNSTVEAWEAAGGGARPGEGEIIARSGDGEPVHRYASVTARRDITGDIEAMPLWAGQGVGLVRREQTAAEIVAEVVAEAEERLAGLAALP